MWLVFFSGVKISATFFLFRFCPTHDINIYFQQPLPPTHERTWESSNKQKYESAIRSVSCCLCRSYIEKVWNIVTHEGNTKLPFALEHIRTTTFGAWRKYLRRTMFWKREYRLLFILNKKMHCKDKVYLWSL